MKKKESIEWGRIYAVAKKELFHIRRDPFTLTMAIFTPVFLATYLSQGLLISVTMRKQQLSMQVSMMSGLLPSLLFSGLMFPVENMPPLL